jgi:hypothetical protein
MPSAAATSSEAMTRRLRTRFSSSSRFSIGRAG